MFKTIKKLLYGKDRIDSYFLFITKFAVRRKSTDLYFYIDEGHIRVFYNPDKKIEKELDGELGLLPPEVNAKLKRDILGVNESLEQLILPKGFLELTSTNIRYHEGLENVLAKRFNLKSIYDLTTSEKFQKLKINKQKIKISLSKIPKNEGLGYHLKFYYKETA